MKKLLVLFLMTYSSLSIAESDIPHESTFMYMGTEGVITKDLYFLPLGTSVLKEDTVSTELSREKEFIKYEIKRKDNNTVTTYHAHLSFYEKHMHGTPIVALTNSIRTDHNKIVFHVKINPEGKIESSTSCETTGKEAPKCTTVNYNLCEFLDKDLDRQLFEKLSSCSKACDGLDDISIPHYISADIEKENNDNLKKMSPFLDKKPSGHALSNLKKSKELAVYMSSFKDLVSRCANLMQAVRISGKSYKSSDKRTPSVYKNNNPESTPPTNQ